MKKFLSIVLSISLIGNSVFAKYTTNKTEINTNKLIQYSLISGAGILGIAGIVTLSLLLKKNHDKIKSQKKDKSREKIKIQEENRRQTEEIGQQEENKIQNQEEEIEQQEEDKIQHQEEEIEQQEGDKIKRQEEVRRLEEEQKKKEQEHQEEVRRLEEARRKKEQERRRLEEQRKKNKERMEEELKKRENPTYTGGALGPSGPFSNPGGMPMISKEQLIAYNRAPAIPVDYNGQTIMSSPHVILEAKDFRTYLDLFPGTLILFRGVHVKVPEDYYSELAFKGLAASSNDAATGLNVGAKEGDIGKRVYFSNNPIKSFEYSLAGGGITKSGITDDTHCMYLISFIPINGINKKCDFEEVYTGLPEENHNFVLCMSYYSFKLPKGTKYTRYDCKKYFTDYSALTPNASPIRKAIRGLQLWLLEVGIMITESSWRTRCKYSPDEADRLLKELQQEKTDSAAA